MTGAKIEAVVEVLYAGGSKSEEIAYRCADLGQAVSDLETLHNAVRVFQEGGRGSDRGYQFLEIFGAWIKPAYVRGAGLRITYPESY